MRPLEIVLKFLSYDGTMTNDPVDGEKLTNRIQESTVTGVVRYKNIIQESTLDKEILLAGNPSEYLIILTDRQISIKINGSSDSIILSPRANGIKTFVYYTRGAITELLLSNDSGGVANVDIISVEK